MECVSYPELWRAPGCGRVQEVGYRDYTPLPLSPNEFDTPFGFTFQPNQYKEKEKNPQEVADALLSLKHAIVHPQMSPLQQTTQPYYQPSPHFTTPTYAEHDVHGSSLFSVNVSMSMNVGMPQASHPVHQPPWSPHQHHPPQAYEPTYYTPPQAPDDGYFYSTLNTPTYAREPYYFPPEVHNKNDHYVSDLSKLYSRNHSVGKGIKFIHGSRTGHSNMNELSKMNICRICGKNYARPSTLKTHMRTHSGEKPYRCSSCNKSFSQAANLTAHLRTHSGEKPFTCPVCDRRFSQSSSVTTHMRTHSGERPYRCRMCKKAFSDSSTLTKHLRIHSGEKPYQCKICLLRFSQSGNLNRHMRVHAS